MKLKHPTQRLVARKQAEIRAWRAEGASWEAIAMALEKDTQRQGEGRAAVLPDSIRKAWLKISPEVSKILTTSQDNMAASRVNARTAVESTEPFQAERISQEISRIPKTSQDKRLQTPVNSGISYIPTEQEWEAWPLERKLEQGFPESKPDGTRYMRPLKIDEAKLLKRDARAAEFDNGNL